jgi:hypothetical protein
MTRYACTLTVGGQTITRPKITIPELQRLMENRKVALPKGYTSIGDWLQVMKLMESDSYTYTEKQNGKELWRVSWQVI